MLGQVFFAFCDGRMGDENHNEAKVDNFINLCCLILVFVYLNEVISGHLVQLDLEAFELIYSYSCIENALESEECDDELIEELICALFKKWDAPHSCSGRPL
jgi:hypothetical protein